MEQLRPMTETARHRATKKKGRLGMIYMVRRVKWARARDQTVTGEASATSSAAMHSASL